MGLCCITSHEDARRRPHQDSRLGQNAILIKTRTTVSAAAFPFRTELLAPFFGSTFTESVASTVTPCWQDLGHLDSPRSRLGPRFKWPSGQELGGSRTFLPRTSTHRIPHPSGKTPSSARFEQNAGRHPQQRSRFGPNSRRAILSEQEKNSTCIVCPRPTRSQWTQTDSSDFHRASTARPVNSLRHARASTMVTRPPQGIHTDTTAMRLAMGAIIIRYPSVQGGVPSQSPMGPPRQLPASRNAHRGTGHPRTTKAADMIQLRLLLLVWLAVSSSSTHVPLHSFSAPSGSLNLRCLNCVLVFSAQAV